jgi:transposase
MLLDLHGGMTQNQICKKYHVGKETISVLKKRFASNFKGAKCGKKQILTDREKRHLVYAARKNIVTVHREAQQYCKTEFGKNLSKKTVKGVLGQYDLKSKVLLKKERLTEERKLQRLFWSQVHERDTDDDLLELCCADETNVTSGPMGSRPRRYLSKEDKNTDREFLPVEMHGVKVNVCGMITTRGPGPIRVFGTKFDSTLYCDILTSDFVPFMDTIASNEVTPVLVQDNFSVHKSKEVMKIISDLNIHVEFIPPYSPETNPIENIWSWLRAEAAKSTTLDMTVDALAHEVIAVWERLPVDVCRNAIRNIPEVAHRLIHSKGSYIRG